MQRSITLTTAGAGTGRVTYTEGLRSIVGHQQSGEGDVLAIVSMGSVQEWRAGRAWALSRRSEILRFVAEQVIAQRFPDGSAEIDEASGEIMIRDISEAPFFDAPAPVADTLWGRLYKAMKGKVGLLVLAAVLAFAAAAWLRIRIAAL